MEHINKRQMLGWVAVGLSLAITCFWAFWGIVENFHEGWFYASWLKNVGLMLAQYLSPILIFMGVTSVAIYWPRVGGILYMLMAVFAVWFFRSSPSSLYFIITLTDRGRRGAFDGVLRVKEAAFVVP